MGRGGNQSRGRSRRLPSSGGDSSREVGPSPRRLCGRSGTNRRKGRSRLLGREPGEEGGLDTLDLREGCGRGLFLGFERSNAWLTLHVGPCHFFDGRGGVLEPMALGGVVTVKRGELRTKRGCHAFVFGRSQDKRCSVRGGPRGRIVRHLRVDEAFLHLVKGRPFHGGHLLRGKGVPNGCHAHKVGGGVRHWRGGRSVVVARRGVVQGCGQFSNPCWPGGP